MCLCDGLWAAFAMPHAVVGRQAELLAGAQLWVVLNPSGLNARSSLADVASAYHEVRSRPGFTSPVTLTRLPHYETRVGDAGRVQ